MGEVMFLLMFSINFEQIVLVSAITVKMFDNACRFKPLLFLEMIDAEEVYIYFVNSDY